MCQFKEDRHVKKWDESRRIARSMVNRRSLLKGTAAGGAGLALASPKASKVFAAPTLLQGEQIELDYVTWFWNEPGRGEAWRQMIADFQAEQSEIVVNEAGWPFDEFSNNIIIQLQAGSLEGDLIQTTPDLVLRLLQAGVTTSLNPVLEANNITTLSSAHDYITVDGEVQGLDVVTVVFGLLYNTAIFENAGVTTMPTTPEEWLEVSTGLTERPNIFGMYSPHTMSEASSFWFTLQQWGCIYDGVWAEGSTPMLTSEPILNGLNLYKQFYDATFPQGTDDSTARELWANQQIAQQLIVSALVNVYKDEAPDLYPLINSYSLPWESKKAIARIHPITVNNQSEKQEAAMEWVTWLYKPENYANLVMRQLDVIPAYDVGDLLDDYLAELHWLTGYQDINQTTPPDMVGDFIFANDELGQIVLTNFQNVLTGAQSVEDAMAPALTQAEARAGRLE
jgi:ABC-type glycerol-3-phosphate transport system substrate-binding protein